MLFDFIKRIVLYQKTGSFFGKVPDKVKLLSSSCSNVTVLKHTALKARRRSVGTRKVSTLDLEF